MAGEKGGINILRWKPCIIDRCIDTSYEGCVGS